MTPRTLAGLLLLSVLPPAIAQTGTIGVEGPPGEKECSGYFENGCQWAYGYHPTHNRHTLKTNCGNGWQTSTGDNDLGLCEA